MSGQPASAAGAVPHPNASSNKLCFYDGKAYSIGSTRETGGNFYYCQWDSSVEAAVWVSH